MPVRSRRPRCAARQRDGGGCHQCCRAAAGHGGNIPTCGLEQGFRNSRQLSGLRYSNWRVTEYGLKRPMVRIISAQRTHHGAS